jgi:hypothetical protein
VKLGEIPGGEQNSRPIRVLAPTDAKDTAALIEKLRAAWPTAGTNQLIIKGPAEKKPEQPPQQKGEEKKEIEPAAGAADRETNSVPAMRVAARFAQLDSAAGAAANGGAAIDETSQNKNTNTPVVDKTTNPKAEAPPVTITITEDGRLMLSSSDTAALDRLEELIEEVTPPAKRFKVFTCKYIRASEMWYDLTDFFKEDLEDKSQGFVRDWNGFMVPTGGGQKDTGTGLSKRRKLMITYDRPSNSILVANASATQLSEIQQLIEQFDKPSGTDSVEVRQTAAIKIQYSRPSIIAAAVKEVYRDLLSKRDKEFDRNDKREERSSTEHMTVINYSSGTDDNASRPTPVKIGFDGALSLGADDVSGVLIVSAQKALFGDIVRMVQELDKEAAPKTTVQVHHINGNVSAKSIQQALDKAVGKAWLGNRPEQQPAQTGQDGNKRRNNRNNNRGEQQQPQSDNAGNEGGGEAAVSE